MLKGLGVVLPHQSAAVHTDGRPTGNPQVPFPAGWRGPAGLWKAALWHTYLNVFNHDGISNPLGLKEYFDCLDVAKGDSDVDSLPGDGG